MDLVERQLKCTETILNDNYILGLEIRRKQIINSAKMTYDVTNDEFVYDKNITNLLFEINKLITDRINKIKADYNFYDDLI